MRNKLLIFVTAAMIFVGCGTTDDSATLDAGQSTETDESLAFADDEVAIDEAGDSSSAETTTTAAPTSSTEAPTTTTTLAAPAVALTEFVYDGIPAPAADDKAQLEALILEELNGTGLEWSDSTVSISGSESVGDGFTLVSFDATAQSQQGQVGSTNIEMRLQTAFLFDDIVLGQDTAVACIELGECGDGLIDADRITTVSSVEMSVTATRVG